MADNTGYRPTIPRRRGKSHWSPMIGSTCDTTWTIEQVIHDPSMDPEDTHLINGKGTGLGSTTIMKVRSETGLGQTPIAGAT